MLSSSQKRQLRWLTILWASITAYFLYWWFQYLEGTLHGTLQAGYHGGWLPMCIGSHYTVRTKALKEVGGLGPELAEDHSTTLLMASGGWKGIHSIDAEAHGDGPPSFAAGMIQEFQWARSLVMIFLEMTPRVLHKLPLRLKFQIFFGHLWYFLFSFAMLSAFALPVIGLIEGNPFAKVTYTPEKTKNTTQSKDTYDSNKSNNPSITSNRIRSDSARGKLH